MKKLKPQFLFLFIILPFFQVSAQENVTKLNDGIEIKIKKPQRNDAAVLRIQVVSNTILHITASPTTTFDTTKSLMLLDDLKPNSTPFEVINSNDTATLSTKNLKATVSIETGEIVFKDAAGKTLLQETKGGGKTITGTTLDGKQSYIVKQSFTSETDEALYGLGQHQNGVFNYKGTKVLLSQYNTEVAIPFLVSSKNYGILWDNNSLTKSIDTQNYDKISTLRLYSATGDKGWLTATYTDKKDPNKVLTRPESYIDYSYIPSLKQLPEGIKLENTLVKWEGSFESDFSGEHQFNLWLSGYTNVYIDDKLVTARWRQGWNATNELIRINLEKGVKHKLKIEWDPLGNESFISFTWAKPKTEAEKNEFAFESEAGQKIDYFFVSGKNIDDVISGYRTLTGKATMMPKWSMGFWQSRERYNTQDEIMNTVAEFRKRKIGLDNIVLDWRYWREGQWGSQEFDPARFPDPKGMMKTLHEKYNTNLMISVWAKFYEDTQNYKDLDAKGYILKRNVAENRKDWLGFNNAIYDPYNPDARKEFWKLINKNIYSTGIDAWWMDASEPDIHSNMPPEVRKEMIGSTFLGAAEINYNAFSLMNAKGIYEGQRSVDPNKRIFMLTRSGFAGLQRYAAATWSGDIGSRWEDLKNQIPAGLNFSMSGLPYWTTDIGGFSVETRYEKATGETLEEWRELNARWYQYGVFCPLFRAHGQFPYREIFNIAPEDHPAYKSILNTNRLRYRLMPYIYSLMGQIYQNDYTMMRGLPMDFSSDKKVLNIADQFMFGSAILVNPVTEYKKRNREVYLPNTNGWYNFYTSEFLEGGQTITAKADYDEIPLYVKEGSILPCGPNIEYTSQKSSEPFTIYVYTGKDANFSLYEDENTNYNYEKGKFSNIDFNYNQTSKTLTIGDRKGSFDGMQKNRVFNIVFIDKTKNATFQLISNPNEGKKVKYNGAKTEVKF